MYKLKPHQARARKSIIASIKKGKGSAKGRIVIPTGGGKTFIEAAILDWQRQNNISTKIHLVLAPRILLTNQLIAEFRKFSGLTYRAIAFHSGNHEPDYEKTGIKWKEEATTRVEKIQEAYKHAVESGQDLVIFSTYHSAAKLIGINFDTLIADESQYCVNEGFNDVIKKITARVKLFFTATEKHTSSDNGRGLNNSEIYGERIYYISPEELILLGLIVPPRLHVMYGETKDEDKSVFSEVVEIAHAQDKITQKELGFSKILFAMKGTKDVKEIADKYKQVRFEFPNHDIFTISTKNGARVNNVKIPREDFIDALKTSKNCLIFHYDILSEGIDVDGITGVVLLRNMGLAKLLQTIGRAVRIYKSNPKAKRWALISVSVINGNEDDMENVRKMISAIRNGGYDISKEDVVETGNTRHESDDENVDDAYANGKSTFSSLFMVNVFHKVEEEEFFNALQKASGVKEKIDMLFV